MKKLAFITDSGFWSHDTEIVKELNKRYDLTLFINFVEGFSNHSKKGIIIFCKKNKIKLNIQGKNFKSRNPLNLYSGYQNYVKKVVFFKPDIIYIESFGNPYLVFLFRLFFGNKNTVIALHDFELHHYSKNKPSFSSRLIRFLLLNFYTYFHFFSQTQKKAFDRVYSSRNSFFARMHSLDINADIILKKAPESSFTFLYFGRIFYYKGVDILIEAANILDSRGINFKLVIAGNGDNFNEYKKKITNQENIELMIYKIPNKQIPKLFASADFSIFPYRAVTQSGPLIISYNFDSIPITSDLDGFKEYVIDGHTGFTFQNKNSKSLADKMELVLKLSAEERRTIIANISKFKEEEMNIASIADKYTSFFLDIYNK